MQFNVTVEIVTSGTRAGRSSDLERLADELVDQLADFHPSAAPAVPGRLQVTVTVEAESLRQAALLGLGVVGDAAGPSHELSGVAVIGTGDFDSRLGLSPNVDDVDLLSVGEVAAELGISRQAVLKRIKTHSLPATQTSGGWIVSRAVVEEAKRLGHRRAVTTGSSSN